MGKLQNAYLYCKEKYDLLNEKKYTTIAGTLVFFLMMSMMPLAFWLTLFIGKLPATAERMLELPVFDSIGQIVDYIRAEAARATSAASIFLAITTLYSATNLFYQMRKSGEIIYEVKRKHKGLKTRLGALVVLFIVLFLTVVLLVGVALLALLFSIVLPKNAELVADYVLLFVGAFSIALLFNAYICPHKVSLKCFIPGALLTMVAWGIASVGFAIYLKVSSVDRLYGALSVVIVFLLWLYVMMICFIVGVIFNSERVEIALLDAEKGEN